MEEEFDYLEWLELEIEMDVEELSETLSLSIEDTNEIPLTIKETDIIELTVEEGTNFGGGGDPYEGSYVITPRVLDQILPTGSKTLQSDVLVKKIPASKVSNQLLELCKKQQAKIDELKVKINN